MREGTRVAVPWDCARVDVPSGLLFEGDLGAWVWAATTLGLLFEGDLVGLGIAAPASSW